MHIRIDGKTVYFTEKGKDIVDVAEKAGIGIPAPCYRSSEMGGCCRACVDEIDGQQEELIPRPADERDFREEIASCLISLTDQLPKKYKQPLKATDVEGKTQSLLSEERGLSLPVVKSIERE